MKNLSATFVIMTDKHFQLIQLNIVGKVTFADGAFMFSRHGEKGNITILNRTNVILVKKLAEPTYFVKRFYITWMLLLAGYAARDFYKSH